jgi:hypothetical protein
MASHRRGSPRIVSHLSTSLSIAPYRQASLRIAPHGQQKAFLTVTNRQQTFIFHHTFARICGRFETIRTIRQLQQPCISIFIIFPNPS